ncbi:hypothetical protein P7F88_04910 [Vibrio hannami]|uniref:hypothetical protein n=1 Tax=Vibrio hannami TaxID=2717094 RepID=UPI00240EB40D|nr:hypothetical protein [Vibrio hannami]MDG3085475.1 hypothetical protein [Vibrio hannami]
MANIHDHVDYVFDEIVSYAGHDFALPTDTRSKMKPAPPGDKEQLDLFKTLSKSQKTNILPGVFVGEFYGDNTRYLIVNLPREEERDDSFNGAFEDADFSAPMEAESLYCVKEFGLKVNRRNSKSLVMNNLLYQQEEEEYAGHNLLEVFEYFETFSLCRIDNSHILYDISFDSLTYLITMQFEELIPLPLDQTLSQYAEVFAKKELRPIANIFLSLTSTHWKHAFLELYRCFEGLFVIPSALCLKQSIDYEGKAIELADKCIDSLDWRRKEEISLRKLLQECMKSELFNTKLDETSFFGDLESKSPEKVANKLYKLRNINVHQAKETSDLQDNDWVQLLSLMLVGIEHLYESYSEDL